MENEDRYLGARFGRKAQLEADQALAGRQAGPEGGWGRRRLWVAVEDRMVGLEESAGDTAAGMEVGCTGPAGLMVFAVEVGSRMGWVVRLSDLSMSMNVVEEASAAAGAGAVVAVARMIHLVRC